MSPRLITTAALLLALAGAGVVAVRIWPADLQAGRVAVPQLPAGLIELRVLEAVNPRFPRMSDEQRGLLLATLVQTARAHFGVRLTIAEPVTTLTLDELFKRIPEKRRKQAQLEIYDFKGGRGDRQRLSQAFAAGLERRAESLEAQVRFVTPYVGALREHSYAALGAALADLQLERIQNWRNVAASLDGRPAIDDQPYNEFSMWLALGYGEVPYELVLTNQPIASVEYVHPAVHSAIRGGYTNGLTTYSAQSRFGTMSVWSTFAFTTDDPWVRRMRGGETYSVLEAASLAGIGATHEIGHQLFHFGHPFGQESCVMNPVPLFAYRNWAQQLSAADCLIGSRAELRPGASALYY